MNTELTRLLHQDNPDLLQDYVNNLKKENFSLVTLVDSLAPYLVMESNLRFGSFHLIKMSLFLRSLCREKILSPETEIALARVVILHLYYLEWIQVTAGPFAHTPDPITRPVEKMLVEIGRGNAHNAFFYADVALQTDKANMLSSLLLNGAAGIRDTLGHSLSCFFPVLEDIVAADHPAAGTSLFSYITFLCRLRGKTPNVRPESSNSRPDKVKLLRQAASGSSIVDIHHMITFYIYQVWEQSAWNSLPMLPWHLLSDWIGSKEIDNRRLKQAQADDCEAPREYEQLRQLMSGRQKEKIVPATLSLLEISWQQTCDWLLRAYADYYTPDWDPHYYTSLYAALRLCRDDSIAADVSKMALIQALEYFLDNV